MVENSFSKFQILVTKKSQLIMEINTINQIKDVKNTLKEKIKNSPKNNDETKYGNEGEYTMKSLLGGLDALLTDISTLTNAPLKFIKLSTYDERNNIFSWLNVINDQFNNPYGYISYFENLKLQIRNYNVRNFSDRQIEFEKEIDAVLKIKIQLQEELFEVKKIKQDINQNNTEINNEIQKSNENLLVIEKEIDVINEKKERLIAQSQGLEDINDKLSSIKQTAETHLIEITNSMNESKSNEKLILSFSSKIHESEKKIEALDSKVVANIQKIATYENERKGILNEAESLIKTAKEALNYKTAEGISASFQEQYECANKKWLFGSWILGAGVCLALTVGLGIWILSNATDDIVLVISRISLMPLPIIGTIFCANQYTRQKNIIEDYAYKMVLSKAIVGFSEQLKKHGSENNEEYVHYIKTALREIHKDPLRKREKKKVNTGNKGNLDELIEVAERIVKLAKP